MIKLDGLKPREKAYVVAGIIAVVFAVYFKLIQQPFAKEINYYKNKIKKAEKQFQELSGKYPTVESQQKRIDELNADCDRLLKQITEIEKQLPSKQETSQLIGEFTRLAQEAKLISIRQKTASKDGYNRIFVEIRLNAPYAAAIHYISRIESISPYIKIEEVAIDESKGKRSEEGGPPVRVVVSWILGDTSVEQVLKAKEIDKTLPVGRDILVSKSKPVVELDKSDIKLEGITFNPDNPTVIINGEVFRTGSEVKGMKIKEIKRDGVVLNDGVDDHFVKVA